MPPEIEGLLANPVVWGGKMHAFGLYQQPMKTDNLETVIANGIAGCLGLRCRDIARILIQGEWGDFEAFVSSITDTLASLCQIPALVGFVADSELHTSKEMNRLGLPTNRSNLLELKWGRGLSIREDSSDSWARLLFEKGLICPFSVRGPDLYVVYPAHIIEGAKADESPFEGYIIGYHDGGEHVVKVKGDGRFFDIPDDADLSPFVDSPVYAHGAKIGYWRSRRFVDHEHVVGVVIAGLGDVDIHVVAGVLEAEKETMIPVSVAACFCRVRILPHELGDRGTFDAALQDIDLQNETVEGHALDEGDVVGRAVRRFVVAGPDESEDLVAVFLVELPSRSIGHHKRVERGFGPEGLLVLQCVAIR